MRTILLIGLVLSTTSAYARTATSEYSVKCATSATFIEDGSVQENLIKGTIGIGDTGGSVMFRSNLWNSSMKAIIEFKIGDRDVGDLGKITFIVEDEENGVPRRELASSSTKLRLDGKDQFTAEMLSVPMPYYLNRVTCSLYLPN